MRKVIVLGVALALSGCASEQKFVQDHLYRKAPVAAPAVVAVPAPVVAEPQSLPIATPLVKPRWYDEFRSAEHKIKSKFHKKGK